MSRALRFGILSLSTRVIIRLAMDAMGAMSANTNAMGANSIAMGAITNAWVQMQLQ